MQTKILYCFVDDFGRKTTTLIEPQVKYTKKIRLVADEGKILTKDGRQFMSCVDVESVEGWFEVEQTKPLTDKTDQETKGANQMVLTNFLKTNFFKK